MFDSCIKIPNYTIFVVSTPKLLPTFSKQRCGVCTELQLNPTIESEGGCVLLNKMMSYVIYIYLTRNATTFSTTIVIVGNQSWPTKIGLGVGNRTNQPSTLRLRNNCLTIGTFSSFPSLFFLLHK